MLMRWKQWNRQQKLKRKRNLTLFFVNPWRQTLMSETVKRHHIYKNFESFTRDLLSKRMLQSTTTVTQTTVSNDMEITETSHAIDPITKGPLVRPVRNKHCNHIYGYQSVIDSLAINRRLRCPMVGCSNKTYVIEQDLIEL
ncbi:hypothetical protein HA402_000853 [Bradysia odoriphaga]|nr:hypothetical protein HA402_000853 [Bradysia odoriphaga]